MATTLTTTITKADLTGKQSQIRVRVAHGSTPGSDPMIVNIVLCYSARALTYVPNTAYPGWDELDEIAGVIAWHSVSVAEGASVDRVATLDCAVGTSTTTITGSASEIGGGALFDDDTVDKTC